MSEDIATAEQVIATCQKLRERAIQIAEAHPFSSVDNPEFATLSVSEGTVTVSWPTHGYDGVLEAENVSFPVALLTASQQEFNAWRGGLIKAKKAEAEERRQAQLAEAERRERAYYEA